MAKPAATVAAGLPRTLRWVSVYDAAGAPLALGRVVGDGGTAWQVADSCVLPAWQGSLLPTYFL